MTQLANTIVDDTLVFLRERIPHDMLPEEVWATYDLLIEMLSQDQEVLNETYKQHCTYKREEALLKWANRCYDTNRDYDCEEFS